MLIIYFSFANFRKEEFKDSLVNSSYITANYLLKIPEGHIKEAEDYISSFDDDKEDYLINEGIEVYNNKRLFIYKNKNPLNFPINALVFDQIDSGQTYFNSFDKREIVGIKKVVNSKEYYIFTEAEDISGFEKLQFLGLILVSLFICSLVIIAIFSYYFIKKQLKPLDEFKDQIKVITAQKLNLEIAEKDTDDEINILIKSFNNLMARLNVSFQSQKEFNASASHEMKTPLTRISFQIENLKKNFKDHESIVYLDSIQNEVYHLSDTINSLLTLTRIEETPQEYFEEVRLDEVIFDAFSHVKKSYEDLEIDFQIKSQVEDGDLMVNGVKSLLEIVFINLFKNAAIYSTYPKALVEIEEGDDSILINISSEGEVLNEEEGNRIFKAFSRGGNAVNIVGSGLGLRISKRIMNFHSAKIEYKSEGNTLNIISLNFKK